MADPCDSLTECINSEGSYMCGLCPTGYEGSYVAQAGLEYSRNNKQVCSLVFQFPRHGKLKHEAYQNGAYQNLVYWNL